MYVNKIWNQTNYKQQQFWQTKKKETMEHLFPFFFCWGRNLFFLVLPILIPNRSCVNCVPKTNYWLLDHFFHHFFFTFSVNVLMFLLLGICLVCNFMQSKSEIWYLLSKSNLWLFYVGIGRGFEIFNGRIINIFGV